MMNPSLMESIDKAAEQYNHKVRIAEQEAEALSADYLRGYIDAYEEHRSLTERILIKLDLKNENPTLVGFRDALAVKLGHK
jgi:hypothetical protein